MSLAISVKNADPLKELFELLRSSSRLMDVSEMNREGAFNHISQNPEKRRQIAQRLESLLLRVKYVSLLTESGIGLNNGFFSEIFSRLSHKVLPTLEDDNALRSQFREYFFVKHDYRWVRAISGDDWSKFFMSLPWSENDLLTGHIRKEVLNAIQVIGQRAAALGIEPEVVSKIPRADDLDSPFLSLSREIAHYVERSLESSCYTSEARADDVKHIRVMVSHCIAQIAALRRHREKSGISLRMTYHIRLLELYLARLLKLLTLIEAPEPKEKWAVAVSLMTELVYEENKRNSLRKHFADNLQVITYRVIENTSKTGEYYITNSQSAYWKLFGKAIGGGGIVGIMCAIKAKIYFLHFPIFWEAFFYSLNYSLGFVLIHLLGFTIATKLPAMTASTIAASLSNNGANPSWLQESTSLLTRLIRSQYISLAGNALMAFPVALGIDWLSYYRFNTHIVDYPRALQMIHELNPWESLALPHAAIAGVFLTISGLFSGYYENSWIYNHITDRLRRQPFLKGLLGQERLDRTTAYLERHIGGITSSFILGIFLGCTAAIGYTMGLPLDIRHISFASGNFGYAAAMLKSNLTHEMIFNSVLGIIGIGLVNVTVSFGLSIVFAINSRKAGQREARQLFRNLGWNFIHNGLSFFYPVKEKPAMPRHAHETKTVHQ